VQPVIFVQQRRGVAAGGYSSPAQDYISRVIAADVAAGDSSGLETATQDAYAAFIDDLITDGLLGVSAGVIDQASSILKASCILAGARTLAGALVPLVGPAPTNGTGTTNQFASGDYNRKTGLKTNKTNKYINTNRNNNADTNSNRHLALWKGVAETGTTTGIAILAGVANAGGDTYFYHDQNGTANFRLNGVNLVNPTGAASVASQPFATGFFGTNQLSTNRTTRVSGWSASSGNYSTTQTAGSPANANILIGDPTTGQPTNCAIAFYSIGSSLTLATLSSRVSTLMTALAAAIP
jgi:hypothetical protein